MQEFLGCKPGGIVKRNVGDAKPYAQTYEYAKGHLRLPEDFVRERYLARLVRHFYSPQELRAFTQRWTRGTGETQEAHEPWTALGHA